MYCFLARRTREDLALHVPKPRRAVVQAHKNTRMRVRQNSPLFIDAEFMFST